MQHKQPHLAPQEFECLNLARKGYQRKEIAKLLKISPSTTKGYLENVRHKLNTSNMAETVNEAWQLGLFTRHILALCIIAITANAVNPTDAIRPPRPSRLQASARMARGRRSGSTPLNQLLHTTANA